MAMQLLIGADKRRDEMFSASSHMSEVSSRKHACLSAAQTCWLRQACNE